MSQHLRFTCNRCSVEQSDADVAMGPMWLTVSVSASRFQVDPFHVCPACMPAFADFFKAVPREVIGSFALHDRVIDISAPDGKRITGVATIDEVMTTTFYPERIEIENASQWIIEEYQIGNGDHSTTIIFGNGRARKAALEMPGEEFIAMMQNSPPEPRIVAGPGAALSFRVRYVGGNPEGGVWKAKLFGVAAGFAEEGALA